MVPVYRDLYEGFDPQQQTCHESTKFIVPNSTNPNCLVVEMYASTQYYDFSEKGQDTPTDASD